MKIRFTGLNQQEYARRETLFHTANGYLGVRASFEEGVPETWRSIRGAYINGFYDTAPIHYEERLHGFASTQQSLVHLMDVQGIRLSLGGEDFGVDKGEISDFYQELDMKTGLYTRSLLFSSPSGRRTQVVFKRLASHRMPQLFLIQVEVTPQNWLGEITFVSSQEGDVVQDHDPFDPRKATVGKKMLEVNRVSREGDRLLMQAQTLHSGLLVASAITHQVPDGFMVETKGTSTRNEAVIKGRAKDGSTLTLTKYCVLTDSRRFDSPHDKAQELLDLAQEQSFLDWARLQEEELTAFWAASEARIDGDEDLNASLAYSMYTLLGSAGQDGIGNIASKGLSGEGYEGHYFWDTEIYMFPFFLLTRPEAARQLLISRANMLNEAFLHAREMGHEKGALYAWRTITGSECSAYFPSGSAQYHINGAIAHAFLTYWQATSDLAFMAQIGARVLVETARLWMDAGHFQDGHFRIDSVTGPDEYSCVVNNNYYTNRSAQFHLRGVYQLMEALREAGLADEVKSATGITKKEQKSFLEAAQKMYLPYDETLGIHAQDDAFLKKKVFAFKDLPRDHFPLLMHYHPLFLYRHQVCKQADTVLGHFLFEEGVDEEVLKRTYDYYEPLTTHDSSLSECVFSMMAARVGDTQKAYDYYLRSAELDLKDTHKNTQDGIHAANMGGCYLGLLFGFGGLRLTQEGLSLRPHLPHQWQSYRFRLTYQGTLMEVEVKKKGCAVKRLSGPTLKLIINGKPYLLEQELHLPL